MSMNVNTLKYLRADVLQHVIKMLSAPVVPSVETMSALVKLDFLEMEYGASVSSGLISYRITILSAIINQCSFSKRLNYFSDIQ